MHIYTYVEGYMTKCDVILFVYMNVRSIQHYVCMLEGSSHTLHADIGTISYGLSTYVRTYMCTYVRTSIM